MDIERKKNVLVPILMFMALAFASLPWLCLGLAILLRTDITLIFEDFVYSSGWWWWLALVFIDAIGLILSVRQKRTGFMAFGIFLIFFILVAGFAWLALIGLGKNPPP